MKTPSYSRRDFLKRGAAGLAGAALLHGAGCRQETGGLTDIVLTASPDDTGTLQRLIDAFNDAHAGAIRVTWRVMDRLSDAYFRQLESDFIAGADDFDVIAGDVIWTAAFVRDERVQNLSGLFFDAYDPDAFLEAPLTSAFYNYRVWGVPWFTDAGMLFYRRDLLGQAPPPATWDALAATARRVMQASGMPHGYVFQGDAYEGGVANALEFIWGAGGRVLTGNLSVAGTFGQSLLDPNVITVGSDASARGFDVARSLVADGIAPPEVTTFREQETWQRFLAGEAVFMRNWPATYSLLNNPSLSTLTPEQVGVAPLPASSGAAEGYSCLGGSNLMINARADRRRRDAAWTFIRYLTDPAQQKRRAIEGGYLPTLRSLYDDPEVLQAMPVIGLGREALAQARVRPVSPFYMLMSPRIAQAFNRVLQGEITGAQAAEALQNELETILRRNR